MSYLDGYSVVLTDRAIAQTCTATDCDARGVTTFGGSLRCIGHAIPMPVTID